MPSFRVIEINPSGNRCKSVRTVKFSFLGNNSFLSRGRVHGNTFVLSMFEFIFDRKLAFVQWSYVDCLFCHKVTDLK